MNHATSATHTNFQNTALLLLRVVVAVLFLYHGYMKWGMWSAAPGSMSPGMLNLLKFLSIVEPVAGVALIIGLLTQWAALGLAIIMLGAIYFKTAIFGMGFAGSQGTGWEFDLMIFAGCIALMAFGAGCWSVDAMWCKKA